MEAIRSSETSVQSTISTPRHTPEDGILQIINKLPGMNRTAGRQAVHKLITDIHSKRYRPSGMLIYRENFYAPHGKQRTGRRVAQSREPIKKVKKLYVYIYTIARNRT
jgi:hypothetical protein